jgi:mannose-6-phosphate isomerase-like protein (cupin superfamily)
VKGSDQTFQTNALKSDAVLPGAGWLSEISLLPTMKRGGLCHRTLPAGKKSSPVAHHHVEKIWYVLKGQGEVWRKAAGAEDTVRVSAGTSLTIPPRTAFP